MNVLLAVYVRAMPVDAISEGDIYVIDRIYADCGTCADVCPVGAPQASAMKDVTK